MFEDKTKIKSKQLKITANQK